MQIRMHRSSYATAEQTRTLSGEREADVNAGIDFSTREVFYSSFPSQAALVPVS